jgi:hypothetical protein
MGDELLEGFSRPGPSSGVDVEKLEMPDAGQRYKCHVVACVATSACIFGTNFERDSVIAVSVHQNLGHGERKQIRRRRDGISFGKFRNRPAKKGNNGIVLRHNTRHVNQITDSCQTHNPGNAQRTRATKTASSRQPVACREPQGKMPPGRMSQGHHEAEINRPGFSQSDETIRGVRYILERSWPTSSNLPDSPELDIPSCVPDSSEITGDRFCFLKAKARAPESTVNANDERMGTGARWYSQVRKLRRVSAVPNACRLGHGIAGNCVSESMHHAATIDDDRLPGDEIARW